MGRINLLSTYKACVTQCKAQGNNFVNCFRDTQHEGHEEMKKMRPYPSVCAVRETWSWHMTHHHP
jgi:hypothetical protein